MSSDDEIDENGGLTYAEWRTRLESGDLVGLECRSCGHVTATPKRACIDCGGRNLTSNHLPHAGTVHSETTITVPPVGVDGPFQVGIVELGDARLLGRVEGDVEIGDTVELSGTVEVDGMPAPMFEARD
ncbi:Zn-ribbon domain-containing OB-fold protein [Haladaptatus caseinilyticus]|uniref:Zn-ribbon domain-containing OB-fold protein n=1 Tax=Haladaptatus caseinilyticus TaxID=2993314 RepID=UPI00224B20F4|nr:OB-fold domain-containing protein [Haladaptatus caseinilyticus]